LVILIGVAVAICGYLLFMKPFLKQEPALDKVLYARSTWSVAMQAYVTHGPISQETYRISNDNGAVKMFFSASNRDGSVTKQFNVPLSGPYATFLFEQLRADGIWDLDDKPLRPNSKEQYVVAVHQTLGDEGGSRSFGFSDPKYWATTKAQEFYLRLPAKSMKHFNLTNIASAGRPLRDPRYLKIVNEIRGFGPQSVLDAENLIRSELAAVPNQQSAQRALKKRTLKAASTKHGA
jgi:hypothetical protein